MEKNYGTYNDNVIGSGAWANLGSDRQVRAGYNIPSNEYFASYNWGTNAPGEFRLPDFNVNVPTALGNVGVGTNDGNPNIFGTFQPNNAANYYIQALANLLNRGR
jgi:hypothetical protein